MLWLLVYTIDEKNPTSKEIIMKRVEGYMTRAEQLRTMLAKTDVAKTVTASGTVELEKSVLCARFIGACELVVCADEYVSLC